MKSSWVSWIFVLSIFGQYATADKVKSCLTSSKICLAKTFGYVKFHLRDFPDAESVQDICKKMADAAVCIPDVVKSCEGILKGTDKLPQHLKRFNELFCVEDEFLDQYLAERVCLRNGAQKFAQECSILSDSWRILTEKDEVNVGMMNSIIFEMCWISKMEQRCFIKSVETTCGKGAADVVGIANMWGGSVNEVCGDTDSARQINPNSLVWDSISGQYATADKVKSCFTDELYICKAELFIIVRAQLDLLPDAKGVQDMCKKTADAAVCIPGIVKSCEGILKGIDKLPLHSKRFNEQFCVEGELLDKYLAARECLRNGKPIFVKECASVEIDFTNISNENGELDVGLLNFQILEECRTVYKQQTCLIKSVEKTCGKDAANVVDSILAVEGVSVTEHCGDDDAAAGQITINLTILGLGLLLYFLVN